MILSYKNAFLFVFGASALALAGALVSQYVLGMQPCPLCIWQRWPYAVVMVLSVLGFVVKPLSHGRGKALSLWGERWVGGNAVRL